jgi:hypothetical protein
MAFNAPQTNSLRYKKKFPMPPPFQEILNLKAVRLQPYDG